MVRQVYCARNDSAKGRFNNKYSLIKRSDKDLLKWFMHDREDA